MSSSLEKRLSDALGDGPLASRLPVSGGRFLELRASDAALQGLDGPVLLGLARVLASQPEAAGFLSRRPALVETIAHSDAGTLARTSREVLEGGLATERGDLEGCLDELRLLRREQTCLAACHDLGRVVPFEAVSRFLSLLAEGITRRALALAIGAVAPNAPPPPFAVIGMGKIAGREFTYHSDLDLIFLYEGSPDDIDRFSRIAQRLIHYLGTMTGAGIAYPVDTRLRPSGQQGLLVTSIRGFERYQCEQAQTWEHLALLRARAIAGTTAAAQAVLDRTRVRVIDRHLDAWADLDAMRSRVARERAGDTGRSVALKTGRGGLMDVDFLAAGAVFERGSVALQPEPSVSAMLRAAAPAGPRRDGLLADYAWLRLLEARCRWLSGHAVETLDPDDANIACIADLVEPGLPPAGLLQRLTAIRERVRDAYDSVVARASIDALGAPAA